MKKKWRNPSRKLYTLLGKPKGLRCKFVPVQSDSDERRGTNEHELNDFLKSVTTVLKLPSCDDTVITDIFAKVSFHKTAVIKLFAKLWKKEKSLSAENFKFNCFQSNDLSFNASYC